MATITISSQGVVDAFTAYIAMRLAQDGATVTADQALTELLMIGGINPATVGIASAHCPIKNNGNAGFIPGTAHS